MAAALSRLLPNVGGPDFKVRRLYANAVQSVSLYGAPIWANKVAASPRIKAMIHRFQRRLAVRITRSYRTASFVATTALAGVVPSGISGGIVHRSIRKTQIALGALA